MAQKLKIYLVNQAGDLNGRFEDSHRQTCAATLKTYFEGVIKGSAKYDSVEVTWGGKQGDPTAFDFVCYALTTNKGSIVAKKSSGGTLGISGSTAVTADANKLMISEVYLRQIVQNGDERSNATTNREALVANCIMHELGHNLLDASAPIVRDVHKMKDGVILRDTDENLLKGTDAPNEADFKAFREGFGRRAQGVKQYTGDMPS